MWVDNLLTMFRCLSWMDVWLDDDLRGEMHACVCESTVRLSGPQPGSRTARTGPTNDSSSLLRSILTVPLRSVLLCNSL